MPDCVSRRDFIYFAWHPEDACLQKAKSSFGRKKETKKGFDSSRREEKKKRKMKTPCKIVRFLQQPYTSSRSIVVPKIPTTFARSAMCVRLRYSRYSLASRHMASGDNFGLWQTSLIPFPPKKTGSGEGIYRGRKRGLQKE